MKLCHIKIYLDGRFNMKKVLHYVTAMNRAGQETFIMNVFRNIDRQKVMFDFLVTSDEVGDYDKEIKALGGNIHHIKLNRFKGKYKQIDNFFLLKNKLKEFSGEYKVFHIHTQHAMDAFLSALAAKKAGIKKVVVHSHNANTIYSKKLHNIFKKGLHFLNIERFACGEEAGKWMFGKDMYHIINNGIDVDEFKFDPISREKIRNQNGWSNDFIIGHIGRFNKQKNHEFIIEIFKQFSLKRPNSKLVLIGVGELEDDIKQLVKFEKLEKKVCFLGMRDDVNKLYSSMDTFILPSLFEGLPVVLVEAQAASLPVIMSDSITDEIKLSDEVKELPLTDINEWVNTLVSINDGKSEREDKKLLMRKSGYDIEGVAKKLQKFYLE